MKLDYWVKFYFDMLYLAAHGTTEDKTLAKEKIAEVLQIIQ